jgi:DNA replicative helicase MCM subunit Mcm2 (Cdc46/Mcm family)
MFHSSASKFISYQELKIQETSDQLIEGSIPRSFHVQLLG